MSTEPAQTVPAGLACKACGYDLTGLAPQGVCPECAHPVANSLRADLLRFHDPIWLARVEVGTRWIARGVATITWGMIAAISCLPLVIVLSLTGLLNAPGPVATALGTILIGVGAMMAGVLLLAGPLMLAVGSVFAGSVNSGAGGPVPLRTWPAAGVRWGGPCFVAAVLGELALQQLAPTWSPAAQLFVKAACQASALGLLWSLVARLQDLESRTIDWNESRAKKYRSHRRDLIVAGMLYVIFGWLVSGPGPRSAGGWGASFALLIVLFFYNTTKAAAAGVVAELGRTRALDAERAPGATSG